MEFDPPSVIRAEPKPKHRRVGIGTVLIVSLVSAGLASGMTLLVTRELVGIGSSPVERKYTCPMHPEIVMDDPEKLCPRCGMKLVEITPSAARRPPDKNDVSEDAKTYQCPMHPTIVQDKPGDCPVCGMKLVPMQAEKPKGERKILYYRSPMDPKQTSREPRKDEMGMDYVPVYEDEILGETTVEGMATVSIDPGRQQLIGMRTASATQGPVGAEWRTVGRVAVDETRVRHINIRVPAYVEQIYVDYVGKSVRKGEPLFSVYSPELWSAQEELLLALRSSAPGPQTEQAPGAESPMVDATRRKLQLWNVPDTEIQKIIDTRKPLRAITLYSPIAGVVTKKDVVQGTQLDVGAMPYEVVDLSRVWVLADVYESELRRLQVDMPASFTLKALPGRVFEGTVSFVAPLLNPDTRTATVRLAFANPTGELRPDMFGEVVLHAPPRAGLRIPRDAVIDSGTRSVVFVALGDGKFQPREVELGETDGTYSEVLSGLVEGDQVVTRANFLIDSESRLRASLAALGPSGSGSTEKPANGPTQHERDSTSAMPSKPGMGDAKATQGHDTATQNAEHRDASGAALAPQQRGAGPSTKRGQKPSAPNGPSTSPKSQGQGAAPGSASPPSSQPSPSSPPGAPMPEGAGHVMDHSQHMMDHSQHGPGHGGQ